MIVIRTKGRNCTKRERHPPSSTLKKDLSPIFLCMWQQDQIDNEDDPAHNLPTSTEIQMPIPIDNNGDNYSDNKYLTVDTKYYHDILGGINKYQFSSILVEAMESFSTDHSRIV